MKRELMEPEIEEYLKLKDKNTAGAYASAYRKFLVFYQTKYGKDKGFSNWLDRIFEEFKKPPRDQDRIAEKDVSEFINSLKEKLSNNTIRLYMAALQNFLKYKNVVLSSSFIDLPAPIEKKVNGKHEWHIEQIKEFVDAASSYRDKAIIMCMFQSGLAVNEICNLNYEDVQDELESGALPICLKLVRQKAEVEFKTFFGRDAVHYLKLYLATRGELKPDDPLFVKERVRGGEVRISDTAIQESFSQVAKNVDFIKKKMVDDAYNPARPHSLRAAFNSRLIGKIDETMRNFWMGHNIGAQSRAYLAMPTEEMRKLYMGAEEFLKIERTSREELDEKIRSKSSLSELQETRIKELEIKVVSMEKMYNLLFEVSPQELRELMQEISRRKFIEQREVDKNSIRK
jgi:integrase